jgi:dihydroorotate dehydrogenase subfamily 1
MADIQTTICGISFPNPIWTAAGPGGANAHKLIEATEGGAGGLVTKTISVKPAKVPIPNISSPFPGSLINTELWSEIDYKHFFGKELPKVRALGLPIIASLGYSPEDLNTLGRELQKARIVAAVEFSIHYIGKDVENLRETALALKNAIDVPVLVKFSPSIQNLLEVVLTLDEIVDGYVAINSLGPALDFNIHTLQPSMGSDDGRGWLSGKAILPIGLHFVETLTSLTKKPVIGVGGIRRVEDVIKYIMVGASAVQVCSAAVLNGQEIYGMLASQLSKWMDRHGYRNISRLQGAYAKRKKREKYVFAEGPQLYPGFIIENCKYCDLCVKACMHYAIHFEKIDFRLDKPKCVSCGLCESICPYNALEMVE